MLQELEFVKPGIGTLRVVGDPVGDFLIEDIAFAEFQTEDGTVYGPLVREQVVMILAHPDLVIGVCEMTPEELAEASALLGFGRDA